MTKIERKYEIISANRQNLWIKIYTLKIKMGSTTAIAKRDADHAVDEFNDKFYK